MHKLLQTCSCLKIIYWTSGVQVWQTRLARSRSWSDVFLPATSLILFRLVWLNLWGGAALCVHALQSLPAYSLGGSAHLEEFLLISRKRQQHMQKQICPLHFMCCCKYWVSYYSQQILRNKASQCTSSTINNNNWLCCNVSSCNVLLTFKELG